MGCEYIRWYAEPSLGIGSAHGVSPVPDLQHTPVCLEIAYHLALIILSLLQTGAPMIDLSANFANFRGFAFVDKL